MKLKTRLIIAFFVIVFIPIAMAGTVAMGLGNYQIKALEQQYDIEGSTYDSLSNSIQLLSKITKKAYSRMQEDAESSSDKFESQEYLEKLNQELKARSSFLVVRKGAELSYIGEDYEEEILNEKLPSYGELKASSEDGLYIGESLQVLVKQVDFKFEDGSLGSSFIITNVTGLVPQVKTMLMHILIAVVIILILTSACLTGWIYRGIVTPLKKLTLAAQNIRDGNLDFRLDIREGNEIEELCVDFEEMRKRLKISAEEKIEHDRESKELISNISHDLKTPITAIKGYVEGIMDGVADTPEKVDKYIRTIYNKANEMDTLINELTLYSEIDTNRIPYQFNKMKVSDYFDDCAQELKLDLESKSIELTYSNYADADVEIIADAEQIRRVIHNIVNNSVKYMDKEKGYIHIRVNDVGDYIQIEIEDNGKGIGARELPYIFDRFYRTDASRNSAQGGSGIGLSIVRKIIEEHGGKIWASSKESIGTVMYFVLRKYEEVIIDE